MATEAQMMRVFQALDEFPPCRSCETRIRFGDMECPRCGADLEDSFRVWAERLIDDIARLGG